MEALRNMYQSIAQTEKMAAIENVADPKIIVDGKIMAEMNIMADPKTLQMMKSLRLEKNRRMVKSMRALKSPRLVKYPQPWKNRRELEKQWPAYCLGSAESPTADFSLVPLMSTFFSSLMWWILHVVSKWGMVSWCPAFMGRLSPVLYRLFVPGRHAKKWPKSTRNQKSGFCLKIYWFLSNHNNFKLGL